MLTFLTMLEAGMFMKCFKKIPLALSIECLRRPSGIDKPLPLDDGNLARFASGTGTFNLDIVKPRKIAEKNKSPRQPLLSR